MACIFKKKRVKRRNQMLKPTVKEILTGTVFLCCCCSALATDAKNEVVETRVELLVVELGPELGPGVEVVAERLLAWRVLPLSVGGGAAAAFGKETTLSTCSSSSSSSSLLLLLLLNSVAAFSSSSNDDSWSGCCWWWSSCRKPCDDVREEGEISGSEFLNPPPRVLGASRLESLSNLLTMEATLKGCRGFPTTFSSPLPPATVDAATVRRPKIGLLVAEGIFSVKSLGNLERRRRRGKL